MNRVKQLRTEKGLRQSDLAVLLHVKAQTVSNYELGTRDIDTETLRALCEVFGVTADYLLGFSDVRSFRVPEEDLELAAAYHAAPPSVREGIDAILAPYKTKKEQETA